MKITLYIIFLYLLSTVSPLNAQDLVLYDMSLYERSINDTVGFISLSDSYPLSEHPDSLAVPDLSEKGGGEAQHFQYFNLDPKYRKQFLSKTKISETDKVFIYSYSKNILISFPVRDLNVVACLNIYGGEWPYSQYDYMIGFEINRKFLNGFERYLNNSLVFIGGKSPFVLNQLKPVEWKKMESKKFPKATDHKVDETLNNYNYSNNYIKGDAYMYEGSDLHYFVQNILSNDEGKSLIARHLVVINKKTQKTVRTEMYVDHESASPAPLNFVESEYIEQWTGKLFKNKPPVILGFEYVSFGCPGITLLSPTEKDIYISCDNRH